MTSSSRETKPQTTAEETKAVVPRSAYSVSNFFQQTAREVAVFPVSTFGSINDAHEFIIVATLAIQDLLLSTTLSPDPIRIIMKFLAIEPCTNNRTTYYNLAGQRTERWFEPYDEPSHPEIKYGNLPGRKEIQKESKTTLSHQTLEATRFAIAVKTEKSDIASISKTQLSKETWPCSNPHEENIVAAMRNIWQLLESEDIQFYFPEEQEHLTFSEWIETNEITFSLSPEFELFIQKIIILQNILPDAMQQSIQQMKQAFIENAAVLMKQFSISPNVQFDALLQHLLEQVALHVVIAPYDKYYFFGTPTLWIRLNFKNEVSVIDLVDDNNKDRGIFWSSLLDNLINAFTSDPDCESLDLLTEMHSVCKQNAVLLSQEYNWALHNNNMDILESLIACKKKIALIDKTHLSKKEWFQSNAHERSVAAAMIAIWKLLESPETEFVFDGMHFTFLDCVEGSRIPKVIMKNNFRILIEKLFILKNIIPTAMQQGIQKMKQVFTQNAEKLLQKFSVSPNEELDALLRHLLEQLTLHKRETFSFGTGYFVTLDKCVQLRPEGTLYHFVTSPCAFLPDEKENETLLNRIIKDFKSEPGNLKQLAEVFVICDQNNLFIGNSIRKRFAKLVTCRNDLAGLIVQLPHRELVINVLELYKDIVVEATAKDQVRATKAGYGELLQFCVYQQPHSCVTKPIIQFALQAMNSKTKRLKHFVPMCHELIFILTSSDSYAVRFEKIKRYLVQQYLLIRMDVTHHRGKGSSLGDAVQAVLLQEFELQFETVLRQPISLREKKEEEIISRELHHLQNRIALMNELPGGGPTISLESWVHERDKDARFNKIVNEVLLVICHCLREKTYMMKRNYPLDVLELRISQCRQLLREYQIYVPPVITSNFRLMTLDEFKPQAPGARKKKGA